MPDFESKVNIDVDPNEVFEYISDAQNLPNYLPMMHCAHHIGKDRVRVDGTVLGKHYCREGWFKVSGADHRLEWGSRSGRDYRGWIDIGVTPESGSNLIVHLHFNPAPHMIREMEANGGDWEVIIQESLDRTVLTLKELLEAPSAKRKALILHPEISVR